MARTKGGNRRKGNKKAPKVDTEGEKGSDPAAGTPLVEEREVQPNEEDGERAQTVPVAPIDEEVRTNVEDGEMERSPVGNGEEEDEEEEEDNENNDEGSSSRTVSDPIDSDEETTPMQPMRMYFPTTEYKKKIKLSTRCYIHDTLTTLEILENPLSEVERKWFEELPQFKHIFHKPRDKNHKLMGMWMLLLRTACIEKEKEAWFIVNGVPIRYDIKEHALISGLNCPNYPVAK